MRRWLDIVMDGLGALALLNIAWRGDYTDTVTAWTIAILLTLKAIEFGIVAVSAYFGFEQKLTRI